MDRRKFFSATGASAAALAAGSLAGAEAAPKKAAAGGSCASSKLQPLKARLGHQMNGKLNESNCSWAARYGLDAICASPDVNPRAPRPGRGYGSASPPPAAPVSAYSSPSPPPPPPPTPCQPSSGSLPRPRSPSSPGRPVPPLPPPTTPLLLLSTIHAHQGRHHLACPTPRPPGKRHAVARPRV